MTAYVHTLWGRAMPYRDAAMGPRPNMEIISSSDANPRPPLTQKYLTQFSSQSRYFFATTFTDARVTYRLCRYGAKLVQMYPQNVQNGIFESMLHLFSSKYSIFMLFYMANLLEHAFCFPLR